MSLTLALARDGEAERHVVGRTQLDNKLAFLVEFSIRP